jgi:hypothetical protein
MALYREGKAAMAADGTVTGTGTKWQSSLSLIRPGATIMFLSSPIQMAVVNKVVSDTEIKAITTNGAVVASTDYAILLSDSLTVDGLAQDVAETLRYYQSQEAVIADAVEFFKNFDFESLQNLANQIKADSEAAESSASAAAASENAAKNSEVAAETARDQVQQIINDAGEQSTLLVLAQPGGASSVNTQLDMTVQKYIDNSSPRISDYKVTKGADATLAFAKAFAKAAETTGVVIVDVSCVVDTIAVPSETTIRIADYKTVTHKDNASAHMFILPSDSLIKANNKKGRLRGNSANQSAIRRCISAVGVSNAGVDGVDIRDFNSYGAYFENCEDTFCKNSTIRDITGGAVETAAGEYITNCKRHDSLYNDIRDTGSNGIKFRSDMLGNTIGCRSIGDKVYRAGFIGIANGKCQDHVVINAYCESCVDNGCDMNGCDNTRFINCVSVLCQDGFYMGENGINNCHIINCSARKCKRAGVGSLGSLTRCSVTNPTIDACGSGIYCSGFAGFKVRDGSITNSVKQEYFDNETGTLKTSTGNGIDLQSNLSGCYQPDISGTTFYGNAGYDIAFGSSGTIGNLMLGECSFQDSAGDGKISYGGATLVDPQIRNSQGYITETTKEYTITGDGTTKIFRLPLPFTVANANYKIASITIDTVSTVRWIPGGKTTTDFYIEYGTAPGVGSRIVEVRLENLRPV